MMERVLAVRDGQPARKTVLKEGEERPFRMLQLLSSKPVLYVCNVGGQGGGGNVFSESVGSYAQAQGAASVVISAKIEAEVSQLEDAEEKQEFL